mgnify:CR=1 FL=1
MNKCELIVRLTEILKSPPERQELLLHRLLQGRT